MSEEIGAIYFKADSSEVVTAEVALTKLAEAGPRVEKAVDGVEKAVAKTGKSIATLGQASQSMNGAVGQMRQAETAMGSAGKSAKELQWAMRGVPAQLSDIAVSLQGGMSPLTVFFQQGLQLRDMFGGFGAAAKGLGSTLVGMINPLTVSGAAVAALGAAYYLGSKEIDGYRNALVLSGNQVGMSVRQLSSMAEAMEKSVGTQSAAAAGLAQMARISKVGSDVLKEYTTSAVNWEKATGQGVAETAKQFAALGDAPLRASLALNQQMNHLTASVYDQIKALDQQGRTEDAAAAAQKAYSDAMTVRRTELVENLGYVEKSVNFVTSGAKQMWDAILGIGRTAAPTDQFASHLSKLEAQLSDWKRRAAEDGDPKWQIGISKLQARVDAAKQFSSLAGSAENYVASIQAGNKAYVDSVSEYESISAQYASKETRRTQALTVERNKYNAAVENTKRAYAGAPELAGKLAELESKHQQNLTGINKRFEEKGSGKAQRDALTLDIFDFKKSLEGMTAIYSSSQRIVEAQRGAGLLDDAEYFEARRGFINLEADAQERGLQQELERYQREKVTKENRLQVEKGIADVRAKLDKAQLDRATSLDVLETQRTSAINTQKLAMDSLAASHQRALDLMQEQASREVSFAWMGTKERQRSESLQSIKDSYASEQRQLEDRLLFTPNLSTKQKAQINQRLSYLKEEKAERLRIAQETYTELDSLQSQWGKGAGFAMQNYVDLASNVAQQTADLFTNAFRNMEDGLVSFAMTGKLDFKSLADSIIADLIRIQARAAISNMFGGSGGGLMGSIVSGVGSLFGGGAASAVTSSYTGASFGTLALNATGGVYDSPSLSAYRNQIHDSPKLFAFAKGAGVFGEAGPEAIMPLTRAADGNLGVRAISAAAGGSPNIKVEIINQGQPMQVQSQEVSRGADGGLLVKMVVDQAVAEAAGQLASGYGPMDQAMRARKNQGM